MPALTKDKKSNRREFILQWCVSTGRVVYNSSPNFSVDGDTPGEAHLAGADAGRLQFLMPVWRRTQEDDDVSVCRLPPNTCRVRRVGGGCLTPATRKRRTAALCFGSTGHREMEGERGKKTASPLILIM